MTPQSTPKPSCSSKKNAKSAHARARYHTSNAHTTESPQNLASQQTAPYHHTTPQSPILHNSQNPHNRTYSLAIVTGTRAEWGLLYPLARKIKANTHFSLRIIATGAHLQPRHGSTYKEIESDGFTIAAKIPILSRNSNTRQDIANAIAKGITRFSAYFLANPCDMLILLGDRYEAFAAAIACANANIPIAHIAGGESTQGANDEYMRHCISKMSYLHFPATALYAKRLIQLGEAPERVFNVGSLAVENIANTVLLDSMQLSQRLHISQDFLSNFCLLTFHSSTLESSNPADEIILLLQALLKTPYNIIATKANADALGANINAVLETFARKYPHRILLCASLGRVGYLSALKLARFVIGNSSSGLSEAPILQVPTINIGHRQQGRFMPDSVLSPNPAAIESSTSKATSNPACKKAYRDAILQAISTIESKSFQARLDSISHPFGLGDTSARIVEIIESSLQKGINLKKAFFML
ncbi:UDP-N-acetylglucosamine 2-epimerase (hydrolyzing) [Helicobacter jaachi]|uniref:UDP-N-acetylglucosamine 2-epimerase (Hydrolyzing) n=1 Tax=Helicobacter jaachi TaxID=1677920 RepID=A0A4U8TCQ4_9HELI|nr:UDP-N-acetylglucosamine 2-epimerase [Helicobacter jaachi]TLD97735.1 UDP-N-acetylglucosamine 2-epimerase (hydrolyzing) [Helicobacter jaachi]